MLYYKRQEGWETLKDHPIDRAGDLKHRPISGGAPKNAFFISMQNSFKQNVRQQLLVAAQEYFVLLNKTVIIESNDFESQKKYIIKFNKSNFLHLTGVISNLKASVFFDKCHDSSITLDDFNYDEIKNKTNIKNKLRCLATISSMFDNELFAQEQFVKNRIICKIATSDGSCTIGFSGGIHCVYPKTVLNKNRLDESKPIIKVTPILIS